MTFYIGPEINHTAAFSKKTLFVEGWQAYPQMIIATAKEFKATHISLATNDTFSLEYDWNTLLTELLDLGFMVTLPYPVELHNRLLLDLSRGVLQSRNFVPLPTVHIMDMSKANPNLTLKIDDMSREGTWSLHFHHLMDSNRFSPANEVQLMEVPPYGGPPEPKVHRIPDATTKPTTSVVTGFSVPELIGKTPEEVAELKAQQDLGLDPDSKSQLKPESFAEIDRPGINLDGIKEYMEKNLGPENAAEAYADGATSDPLSAKESKKPVKKK
jgi:hypothetical protein